MRLWAAIFSDASFNFINYTFEVMPNTIAQKLKIKEQFTLLTLHAPENFERQLQPLPIGVKILQKARHFQQVHWFVVNKAQLENELDNVLTLVTGDVLCWIYYPKGTSNIQTDLTRDKGWEAILEHKELQWISLIAFDKTWSAFGFRIKTEADKKKETTSKVREIFNYVNAEKKEVHLPDDISTALGKTTLEATFFNSLSFTNKKEYIEWIITAKRDETRKQRVIGTIERLAKGWKNPRNM
ncbi:MAG: YdeI/OmpD-associated family protein [Weeksellaceae bacterium]|nr:YdeI/OmpD-associated family protein [Weeksellaceae bacterium]